MSCDDLRQALPLLPGTHPDDEARVRAHAVECAACGDLLRAYEADDQALSALQRGERQAPAILDGFTASVMARIAADEQPRRVATPAFTPEPSREAELLRPTFGLRWVAAAAAVLLAVAVGFMSDPTQAPAPMPAPELISTRPDVQPVVPVMSPTTSPDPLPAPRRLDSAPMPQRRRGPIVPVGEGGARRGPGAPGQGELLDAIEQFLPNLHRRMLKEFGDERGEREVRF